MGLDMYSYITAQAIPETDFEHPKDATRIAYWRKHPNLHGWMEQRYRDKGGKSESFNCVPVKLDAQDIEALDRAVNGGTLPLTTGFFFGESREDERADDLLFIEIARKALRDGHSVFYSSWW